MGYFEDFINSMNSIDNLGIPKPQDDLEIYVQDLILHNGLTYDKNSADILYDILDTISEMKVEIRQDTWKLIVLYLWETLQKNKNQMVAMKKSFIAGLALGHLLWNEEE
jgi:hypothetical protein